MAELKVYDLSNNEVGTIDVSDELVGVEVNQNLFYEVIKMQLANKRAGTHSTKRRSEVAGSRSKLFRQKGTGRARRGMRSSPTLRGGGSVFGPKPRDYSYRVPAKVRKGALKSAVSLRAQEDKLKVLNNFELSEIKTKALVEILGKMGVRRPLIIDSDNKNLTMSASNLKGVDVLPTMGLNVYDILNHDELLFTEASIKEIEQRVLKG